MPIIEYTVAGLSPGAFLPEPHVEHAGDEYPFDESTSSSGESKDFLVVVPFCDEIFLWVYALKPRVSMVWSTQRLHAYIYVILVVGHPPLVLSPFVFEAP